MTEHWHQDSEKSFPEAGTERNKGQLDALFAKLKFPPAENVKNMSIKELHELWSSNHALLEQALSLSDAKLSHLAIHGTSKEGLNHLRKNDLGISVWFNNDRPSSPTDSLAMLYSLVASGINHSYPYNPQERGGFVVWKYDSKEAVQSSIKSRQELPMRPLTSMPSYPVPRDPIREVSSDNYLMQSADSPKEAALFQEMQSMEETGVLLAGEVTSRTVQDALEIRLDTLPQYWDVVVATSNPITRGYIDQLVLRLESQAAIMEVVRFSQEP